MRYVDDLTKVSVDEIEHVGGREIIAIVSAPGAHRNDCKVVIVFTDGVGVSYTIDGKTRQDGDQRFIYKPKKVKYLKSLEQIFTEAVDLRWGKLGFRADNWSNTLTTDMFPFFEHKLADARNQYKYDVDAWIEEREE